MLILSGQRLTWCHLQSHRGPMLHWGRCFQTTVYCNSWSETMAPNIRPSVEFSQLFKENLVEHISSAPYHPASNGLAKRFAQTLWSKDWKLERNRGRPSTICWQNFFSHIVLLLMPQLMCYPVNSFSTENFQCNLTWWSPTPMSMWQPSNHRRNYTMTNMWSLAHSFQEPQQL